ncbi:MAG: hypothetical protein JXA99_08920 [Candidatus Lokiarchaeota archaeon]|nr:hypothetical protein [Candidatus Lokiarchaeota archaeon]
MVYKKRIFVLMPHNDDFNRIYEENIKKPLSSSTVDIKRDYDINESSNILNDIIDSIRRSDIIIADLSTHNANVFYELGRTHQMNKYTIQIIQNGENIPFDLAQIRTIRYTIEFNGLKKLTERLNDYINNYDYIDYLNELIDVFRDSRDFWQAIDNANVLLNHDPLPKEQLIKIVEAIMSNAQLSKSWRVKDILSPILKKEKAILPNHLKDYLKNIEWII